MHFHNMLLAIFMLLSKQLCILHAAHFRTNPAPQEASGSLSVCLLLERWTWTDKAVRNTGEAFGNAYSELLNESG